MSCATGIGLTSEQLDRLALTSEAYALMDAATGGASRGRVHMSLEEEKALIEKHRAAYEQLEADLQKFREAVIEGGSDGQA